MRVEDALDQVQSETHAVAVEAAAAVGLVEAVEDERQVVGRDGLAVIAHGDIGLALRLPERDAQRAAGRGELDGVVHQVIEHARDGVGVGEHLHGVLGQLQIDIELLVVGARLKAEHGADDLLRDVKLAPARQILARALKARHVEHAAHEAREPARLVGDGGEVLVLLILGDRAVENAVGKAGDGGHGGLELVRDVGDEGVAALLARLERVCHGVER